MNRLGKISTLAKLIRIAYERGEITDAERLELLTFIREGK